MMRRVTLRGGGRLLSLPQTGFRYAKARRGQHLRCPAAPLSRPASTAPEAVSTGFFSDGARVCLETVHTTTGLPWWGTLVACAVTMRISLAPLSVLQRVHVERLSRVVPLLRDVWARPDGRAEEEEGADKKKSSKQKWAEMQAVLDRAECRPALIVVAPIIQIGTFITASFGVRSLSQQPWHKIPEGVESLREGGLFWFTDLTITDATLTLPLLHTALVLLSLELGLGGVSAPPAGADTASVPAADPGAMTRSIMGGLHTVLNMAILTVFPMVSQLPQAIFIFWISSSTTSLALQVSQQPSNSPQSCESCTLRIVAAAGLHSCTAPLLQPILRQVGRSATPPAAAGGGVSPPPPPPPARQSGATPPGTKVRLPDQIAADLKHGERLLFANSAALTFLSLRPHHGASCCLSSAHSAVYDRSAGAGRRGRVGPRCPANDQDTKADAGAHQQGEEAWEHLDWFCGHSGHGPDRSEAQVDQHQDRAKGKDT